jgi:hypothetical protein
MAHAKKHHSGGTFTGFLFGVVFIIALVIGWAVWSGNTPSLPNRADIAVDLPKAPRLPPTPNPEPLPLPSPAKPG